MIKINKKPKIQKQDLNTSEPLFKIGDKVIAIYQNKKEVITITSIRTGFFTLRTIYCFNNSLDGYYAEELKKLNPTKQDVRIANMNREELCFIDLGGVLQQGIPQELIDNPIRGDMTHVRMNGAWHVFFTGPISQ